MVHSQCEFTTFWFAAKIAKAAGAPLLHTYHTVYEDYTHYFSPNRAFGKRAAAVFSRLVLGRVDGVIVPTDKVKRLLEGYGVRQPIWTVPSGIDCARFRKARRERKERPAGASLRLLFLGRLAREKNLEELLIWMAGSRGKNYHLLVVGDGPYRPELEALAGRLGLYGRVEFAGMVPPEQTAFWYQKGDVFVCASRSETQGLTYLEALAAGLPAVCRADDCLEGVIENGETAGSTRAAASFLRRWKSWRIRPFITGCPARPCLRRPGLTADGSGEDPGGLSKKLRDFPGPSVCGKGRGSYEARMDEGGHCPGSGGSAAFMVYGWRSGIFSSREAMEAFLEPFGPGAPVMFILIQIIQVVIPILPGGISCLGAWCCLARCEGLYTITQGSAWVPCWPFFWPDSTAGPWWRAW